MEPPASTVSTRPEPTGAEIMEEFGVEIKSSGEMSGLVGWWGCVLPGTELWVFEPSLGELRDSLIRHKWLSAHGGE